MVIDLSSGLRLADCSLYMAGHSEAVPQTELLSTAYKLIIVRRGSGVISDEAGKFSVEKNSIVLLLPGEEFSISGKDGNLLYDIVVFSVDSQRYREAFVLIDAERPSLESRIFFDENIENAVGSLCKEIESQPMAYSTELVSLICSQMIVYFIRHFGLTMQRNTDSNVVNAKVCSHVMNYIDSHIFAMKNLREVATEMGYNYSYISSLFHKTTGVTLNNYFKNKRMSEAKKLLSDNKMSISEIARIMNYSSVYAFSKAFKEHFGASPGHYSGRFSNKE